MIFSCFGYMSQNHCHYQNAKFSITPATIMSLIDIDIHNSSMVAILVLFYVPQTLTKVNYKIIEVSPSTLSTK